MPERNAWLDALYVAVGFGVLAFQKAQVRRQELTKEAKKVVEAIGGQLGPL